MSSKSKSGAVHTVGLPPFRPLNGPLDVVVEAGDLAIRPTDLMVTRICTYVFDAHTDATTNGHLTFRIGQGRLDLDLRSTELLAKPARHRRAAAIVV